MIYIIILFAHMVFVIGLHSCNFIVAAWIIYSTGGMRRHLAYAFAMLIYFVFTLYTPAINSWRGNTVLYGTDFSAYQAAGMLIYSLGVSAFSLAYYLNLRTSVPTWALDWIEKKLPTYSWKELDVLFYGSWLVIFLNVQLGGRNFIQMFDLTNPDWRLGVWGFQGAIAYLEDIPDSLAAILIMAIATQRHRLKLLIWLIPTCVMFLLFGWRYRIIFVLIAFVINEGLNKENLRKKWIKIALWVLLAGLVINFITLNRWAVAKREFDKVRWDLTLFTNELLLNETNNSQTFFATLQYTKTHNIGLDYGETMFLFTLYRVIPARFFEGGKKPDPPILTTIHQAFDPMLKGEGNPAICNIGEYYFSFGIVGVIGCMGILGSLLAFLPCYVPHLTYKALYLTVCAFLFQLITRGYFPQNAELIFYLSLPYLLLAAQKAFLKWKKNMG